MSCEKLTKMSGYLEKRRKLSLIWRWKKWWCVLEGQLLIYYKSRIEYTNLSPCCGSLNMALVKNVQPHVGFQIHIMTHTQLIILRTKNKEKQQQWFHALVGVLPQNSYLSPFLWFSTNSVDYRRKSERKKKSKHKDKLEERIKITEREKFPISKLDEDFSNSNPTNESQFSMFEDHTMTEIQNISISQENRIQFQASEMSTSLECRLQEPSHARIPLKCSSEINIRRYSSYHSVINEVFINERIPNRRSISCDCVFTQHRTSSIEQYNFLSGSSKRSNERSQQINQEDRIEECKKSERKIHRKRRNNLKKYNVFSEKSMSFLRKFFQKMESQNQTRVESNPFEGELEETPKSRLPAPDNSGKSISKSLKSDINEINTIERIENDETASIKMGEITPCNDSVEKYISNMSSNNETDLEFSSDSASDIDAIENSEEDKLPAVPVKNVNSLSYPRLSFKDVNLNYSAKEQENHADAKESICIDNCTRIELDSLLLQLKVLNTQCDKSHESLEFHNNIIEDPDYDIPRPHTSLISSDDGHTHEKNRLDSSRDNNLKNHRYDSLPIDMAPDSLEMPWLLNDTKCNNNYWTTKKEFDLCLENDSESEYDYHDSLNSNKCTS